MRRLVQAIILLLFGVALTKLAVSDSLELYVRPAARPWVGLAGLAMLGLAGWNLLHGPTAPEAEDVEYEAGVAGLAAGAAGSLPHGDGHDHGPASPAMWLVLAPVVAVLVIAPPALGTYTAEHAPPVRASAAGHSVALSPRSGPEAMSMFDFLVLSSTDPAALRQQPVLLTGFVLHSHPGGFTLARLVITCCAADASTASASVRFAGPAPADSGWVQVAGSFTSTAADANQTPNLKASSVTAIGQPANPYDH